jgi:hypothetical protein
LEYTCLFGQDNQWTKEFFMKNTVKILGVIAFIAIIGFAMAGCGGLCRVDCYVSFDSQGAVWSSSESTCDDETCNVNQAYKMSTSERADKSFYCDC